MPPLDRLHADDLRSAMVGFRDALQEHRAAINRLNVYPVPDGDTGTNMALTMVSVCDELARADVDLDAVCRAVSHGSLMGARGNSGVILSQILRGLSDGLRAADPADGAVLAAALAGAADGAYGAVMRPVEGTILTVVRAAADSAGDAAEAGADLVGVLDAARVAGGEALDRTPELLPVLAEAGVVDAGGSGLLLLLDALLHVADGRPMPVSPIPPAPDDLAHSVAAHGQVAGDHGHPHESGVADLRYEVMYFLEAPDESIDGFKELWATLGDSIVVVGGEGVWNCHIHTDDIGASIEAGIDVGRPRQIRVTDLMEQVEEERWVREADMAPLEPAHVDEPVTTAVVAVSVGDGVRRIFHSLGVQRIVTGGQTMNPSTADLLAAVESAPADEVVILPNNKNIIPVAEQVDGQTAKTVHVVPTRSVAEGFASLIEYDPRAAGAENRKSMTDAAGSVLAGEVTQAVRDSTCEVGPIAEGDWLGIARDGIVAVAPDVASAAEGLLGHLVGDGHELVTLIEGEGATNAITRHITVWLEELHPDVVVEVHHGGQPLYPYLFGVE